MHFFLSFIENIYIHKIYIHIKLDSKYRETYLKIFFTTKDHSAENSGRI